VFFLELLKRQQVTRVGDKVYNKLLHMHVVQNPSCYATVHLLPS
jgi:hypothetical protein